MNTLEFTPEQTEALFRGTNFGPNATDTHGGRIALMVECVFKSAVGYSSGSTIEGICIEAGLLSEWNKPTRAGARWAYHQIFPIQLQPGAKYAVYPGNVRSQHDGDFHYIGFRQLCELYGVSPALCIDMSRPESRVGRDLSKLVALRPSYRGDYTLPVLCR